MTRIVLAFMLALTFQAVSADVLIIDEVRQAGRMELPKNGQSKAAIETKFGAPAEKTLPWVTRRFPAGSTMPTASTSNTTWCYFLYCIRVRW